MVVNSIFVNNSTNMSLSDRFTILQNVGPLMSRPRQRKTSFLQNHRDAELRNSRLIDRLAFQPIIDAASSLQKRPLRQRIGVINRIGLPNRNTFNANYKKFHNSKSAMLRSSNVNPKKTTERRPPPKQKFQLKYKTNFNLRHNNNPAYFTKKNNKSNSGGFRGRGFRGRGMARKTNNSLEEPTLNQTTNNTGRGRGFRRRGVFRNQVPNQNTNEATITPNTVNTRGRGGNQRRGINRSWFAQKSSPTKEELDKQLDQYMAGTRSNLDKELDIYMSAAMDVE